MFKEDVGDEGEEEKEFIFYNINIDIYYGVKFNSLVFIKCIFVIDVDKFVFFQFWVFIFSEDLFYEMLYFFISNVVVFFFKFYIREFGKVDRDGDKMVFLVEKKIVEFEMGLFYLQ